MVRSPGSPDAPFTVAAALAHLGRLANPTDERAGRQARRDRLEQLLGERGRSVAAVARTLAARPVTVHFQPDRLVGGSPQGLLSAEGIAASGRFENQFVTGISSGSVDAGRDGRRRGWEDRLFGRAYRHAPDRERPGYGTLNLFAHPDGGSVGFGSCHLVLRREVNRRTTFCVGDSHEEPDVFGVGDDLVSIVEHLVTEADGRGVVLGRPMDLDALLDGLDAVSGPTGRVIDGYVEAQVHGGIEIGEDVAEVVADDCFTRGPVGEVLVQLARRHGVELRWTEGPRLAPGDVPSSITFRGEPEDVTHLCRLGDEVVAAFGEGSGLLDARVIGDAARSAVCEPDRWRRWGSTGDVLQLHKALWKLTVVAGRR